MNELIKIDKKDRELLYMLDINARSPLTEIARKTKMSKQRVKYRIERLEKEKIIFGYYPLIDTSRLGFTTFRTYLKLRNCDEKKKNEIISYLKKEKPVWAIVTMAGKWDLALGVTVENIYSFHKFWDELLSNHIEKIGNYQTSVYSPIYHYSKAYLSDKKDYSKIRILGGKEKASFDKIDIKILLELTKNARISLVDLSERISLTPEAIKHRIKQLEKKEIIQGYRAMIDVSKLGYEFYKAEIRLSTYKDIEKIMDFCYNHKNIYQLDKTIGGETLEIEFHVTSLQNMLNIIKEIEAHFPIIEKFDYLTVLSEEKMVYLPDSL